MFDEGKPYHNKHLIYFHNDVVFDLVYSGCLKMIELGTGHDNKFIALKTYPYFKDFNIFSGIFMSGSYIRASEKYLRFCK